MEKIDIEELEKRIEAGTLEKSIIDEKKHPNHSFGAVATRRGVIALIGAIVAAAGLLGLNAINFAGIQTVTGLLGSSSWGAIFGNGTTYMINGILSVICETAVYSTVIGAVTLGADAIKTAVDYKKYNSVLNNLSPELRQKVQSKEIDYETAVTENLINKINGRTHSKTSYFDKAKEAREDITKTKNPFKKIHLRAKARFNEDMVNKSIKTLMERLNELSIKKKELFAEKDKKGISQDKQRQIVATLKNNIIPEMQQIQVFLAEILDKSDKRDPYYACVKHYLKKYHKDIELVTLPSDNEAMKKTFELAITNKLYDGEITDAIIGFCTYAPWIIAKGGKTDINDNYDTNKALLSSDEALLEILKNKEKSKTALLEAEDILVDIKNIKQQLEAIHIHANGINARLERYEAIADKNNKKWNALIHDANEIIKDLTETRNKYINAYDEMVDILKISKTYKVQLKNILRNFINDRTNFNKNTKPVLAKIKDILQQANATHLLEHFKEVVDGVYSTQEDINNINSNIQQKQKEVSKIAGRAGNELGKARNSARVANMYANDAEESAKKAEGYKTSAKKDAEDTAEEHRKATASRKRTQGEEVTATLITGRMNQNMLDQKKKGDELLSSLSEKDEKASDILKEMEDKKAEIIDIVDEVKDIVASLKSVKHNDIKNLKTGYINIINQLSTITNIQAVQEDRLDVIAGTLVASFSDMLTRLKKLNMPETSQQLKELFNQLKLIEKRVISVEKAQKDLEKTQKEQGEKINNLSKEFILLIKNVKSLTNMVQSHTTLIEVLNNAYYTINTDIKFKFTNLVNLVAKNSTSQKELEEFASWIQHDLEDLAEVVNQLKSYVIELQSTESSTPKDEEEEENIKHNFPMSEELAKQIKLYKNFAHAIHRALKDNLPLPITAPTSMKGKKITQEEIASMGGKNMDFSSKGMFKQEVLEICEKHLSKKDFAFVERIMNIEPTKQEESDLEALIGLIEKACAKYNNKKFGVGI